MGVQNSKCFRNHLFDNIFVKYTPLLAIATAYIAYFNPDYFGVILALDLFFLGYHHVISTYTRISLANLSQKEFYFVVYILPLIVFVTVFTIAYSGYVLLLPTLYLHWQWWHYTRQSEGISKAIRFKLKSYEMGNDRLNRAVFYLIPVATFLMMSARQPQLFLSMSVYTIPINLLFAKAVLILASCILIAWLVVQIKAIKIGNLSKLHFYYLTSHHAIYIVSYVLIDNITIGWLAINIWHNMQYIAFVWHVNSTSFKLGVDKKNIVLSWISQPKAHRVFVYFSLCLIISYIFYATVNRSIVFFEPYTLLPLTIIIYQSINFHHYIVDTLIWKLRNPKIQANIGIIA